MELVPNLTRNLREDIAWLTLDRVDDDNEPTEENIPAPT